MRWILTFTLLILSTSVSASQSEHFGDIGRYGLPLSAIAIALAHQDSQGLRQFGLSFGSTLAVTQALKATINERRPRGNSKNSFPSGHTAWAFSAATFLAIRYGWAYGIPAYTVASGVGLSRISNKRHHVHDVVAGAILASWLTYVFTNNYQSDNLKLNFSVNKTHSSTVSVLNIAITV